MSEFWDLLDGLIHLIDQGRDQAAEDGLGNTIVHLRRQQAFAGITDQQATKIFMLAREAAASSSTASSFHQGASSPAAELQVFCRDCAEWAVGRWRGWHPTPRSNSSEALPDLPTMICGECELCGGKNPVRADHIIYQNYHGPFSTGLPDYFYLEICLKPQGPRRFASFTLDLPYTIKGVGRTPLSVLAKAEKLSDEWALNRKLLERDRQERAVRQQIKKEAAVRRREGREAHLQEHNERSKNSREDRTRLIQEFSAMKESERAKALIADWRLPLHAYPLSELPITDGLKALSADEKTALFRKLSGLTGPWQAVKKAINSGS
jgi:hypothetical protein